MFSWIIQTTIISFIFIFLVHHLFHFFKNTLTVPKIKDLVNNPSKKYENIYRTIYSHQDSENNINNINNTIESSTNNQYLDVIESSTNINDINPSSMTKTKYNKEELLPTDNTTMKDELKNFLKKQLDNTSSDFSNIQELSSSSNLSNSYYEFK